MNWRRGLWRAWIVFCATWSAFWIVFWLYWAVEEPQTIPPDLSLLDILTQFGPTVLFFWVLTAVAYGLRWIARGFRGERPGNG
jgi:hypothetical protein